MTNTFPKFLILATLTVTVVSCGSSDSGGGSGTPGSTGGTSGSTGGSTSSTPGTEGGPCYGNGSCNAGLTCGSNLCVKFGGSGGSGNTTGSGGITGDGGVPVGSGGVHPGSGGVSPGTGGTITSTGGTSTGTGGSTSCTNTQTDPNNCGTCGHVCKGTCTSGKCNPAFGGCFDRNQFDTCDAFCGSIAKTCVTAGCAGFTWFSWTEGLTKECAAADSNTHQSAAACGATLPARDPTAYTSFNCCCQ